MTTHDFGDGRGPVAAHQHQNGGGWVAETAGVEKSSYIGEQALVYGQAHVSGQALVYGQVLVSQTPYRACRSDGYDFILVTCADGALRVIAGCRYVTLEEARAHWRTTRAGTQLGAESLAIVDYLERMATEFPYAVVTEATV